MKAGVIKRLVLDASVAVAWCFPDESTPFTEGILDLIASGTEAVTAAIWPLEVANALLMGERRKRISVAQVTTVLQRISALPITVDPTRTDTAFGQILAVARQEQLTEYMRLTWISSRCVRTPWPRWTMDYGGRRGIPGLGWSRSELELEGLCDSNSGVRLSLIGWTG